MSATKTFDGPGKGRTQCRACGVYIGARSEVCVCGNPMRARPETPHRAEKRRPASSGTPLRNLRIPDGPNPVPLKGRDEASILAWAETVRQHWSRKGWWLMREGLGYYLQGMPPFEDNEKALEKAHRLIDERLTDERP